MAPSATSTATATSTAWTVEFDTVRREKLFRHPPKDRAAYPRLREAVRPHVDSFNRIFGSSGDGSIASDSILRHAILDIGTRSFLQPDETDEQRMNREGQGEDPPHRSLLQVRIVNVTLGKSLVPDTDKNRKDTRIWPAECRERHATYRGRLAGKIEWRVDDGAWQPLDKTFGYLPLMLCSNRCHLEKRSPAALAAMCEETEEQGGYFIVNGNEKLIRMLIVNKRNYPMAIVRPTFVNRGKNYTRFGVQIRCARPDQTTQSICLHYLTDGNITFRFSWRKAEYLVPVMMVLKALVETNDREIFENLVGKAGSLGAEQTFVVERVELLLRSYKSYGLHGKYATRAFLGQKFKPVLDLPLTTPDYEAGTEFLRRIALVHLGNVKVTEAQDRDKFHLLLFMIRKLYSLVAGDCTGDNPDAASSQEILTGGSLYGMILKEKFEEWIQSIRAALRFWSERSSVYRGFKHPEFGRELRGKIMSRTADAIGQSLEYFLSTGNLASHTGLDLQQTSGFTIIAEKINFYRFMSHFRCVHRGAFFAQLKTTTVRKLLPESWGFLCPVHTPDGAPCGLLNHLAHECKLTTSDADVSRIPSLLASIGLSAQPSASSKDSLAVLLDGRVVGFCRPVEARVIADTLRFWKVEGSHGVPLELEIGLVSEAEGGLFPGLYLFSGASRMLRAVKYLALEKKDMIGPFEQQYMTIALDEAQVPSGPATHIEYDVCNILSIFANQTPFSDHNQSPRNMYQCQMAKQTMGTPGTALSHRTDNKAYRLQTGQTPIARPELYHEYGLDHFPNGTNAIVAVISYTGYDMDDAMILNKMAHERGFAHGSMYKTKVIRLDDESGRVARTKANTTALFGFSPKDEVRSHAKHLDADGLPYIGTLVVEGTPLCASHAVSWDVVSGQFKPRAERTSLHRYKDVEAAYVEEVRLLGMESGDLPCQSVSIKLRLPRPAVIGDKFSSRHGQKGVCSQKWPAQDLPFTETGMMPDVIINPHAFPSRMTIGMFIESLAGKAGSLHGLAQDAAPWRFSEAHPAADYFGEQLRAAGFNYHGNEPMYSGITGECFPADIFIGVVFYQRLRHMVADKFQVRTTGPVNPTTGQPIKGRAKGGGIRVGEMERDALLAHGAAYLLADRLLHCSDYTRAWICKECGSFLATQASVALGRNKRRTGGDGGPVRCRGCARKVVGWQVSSGWQATQKATRQKRAEELEAVLAGDEVGDAGAIGAAMTAGSSGSKPTKKDKGKARVNPAADVASTSIADVPSDQIWRDASGHRWVGGENTTVVAIPGVLKYLDAELCAMGVRMRFGVEP
jgi:DNA-directed RNA polymerase I subunit RPA2